MWNIRLNFFVFIVRLYLNKRWSSYKTSKKRGKTLLAEFSFDFSSLAVMFIIVGVVVIVVAKGIVGWVAAAVARGVGADVESIVDRLVTIVVERSATILERLFKTDVVFELLMRVARWRRYWFDCWINGDDGVCKQEFKFRTHSLTNWLTQSMREWEVGYFRWDKRKKASINAEKGNPRRKDRTTEQSIVSYRLTSYFVEQIVAICVGFDSREYQSRVPWWFH